MGTYFRLPKVASLVIPQTARPPIAITRLVSDIGMPERMEDIPAEKAFVVSVHLAEQTGMPDLGRQSPR
jgi:hypothetical protein